MMWWYGNGMHGWISALITVGGGILLAVIIFGGVALLRGRARSWWAGPRPTAEELLAERFARGDIDEQEYRRLLGALRAHELA